VRAETVSGIRTDLACRPALASAIVSVVEPVVPPVSVFRVLDPEMLVAAIRHARFDCCQVSRQPAPSMLGRVVCGPVCLDLAALGPAMLFHGPLAPDCYTMMFVSACPQPGRSFNLSLEHGDGYLGFFPPGEVIDVYTPEGYANAALAVPVAEFHAALDWQFPEIPGSVLERGTGVRVGPTEEAALRRLLAAVQETLGHPATPLADEPVRRQLEHELVGAFIAALRRGCTPRGLEPTVRAAGRLRRLRQARDYLAGNLDRLLRIDELCAELGLTERGVEKLFRDLLDLTPAAYLRHLRLHHARRRLLQLGPESGAVKQAALGAGFWHLGRFAQDYRKLFGERPSETLGRRALR